MKMLFYKKKLSETYFYLSPSVLNNHVSFQHFLLLLLTFGNMHLQNLYIFLGILYLFYQPSG